MTGIGTTKYFVDLSCMCMTMSSFVYNFPKENPKIILSMGFER